MRRPLIAFLVCAALSASAAFARAGQQAPAGAAESQASKWTIDDVVMAEQVNGFEISPDGRWVVWVKSAADKEKNARVSNLVLSSLTENRSLDLTRGAESSSSPKWSPDGQLIAFVTTRPDPRAKPAQPADGPVPQLWLINPSGGEPWALTNFARGVTSFEWADADTIIFAAPEDPSLYENNIKEKKDTSVLVEDEEHAPPVRLFKFSVKAKKFTRLTDNADRIQSFAVSPDGTKAVTLHDRSLRFIYDQKIKPLTFLYDLTTGERKQIFDGAGFNIGQVKWARDGRGFYAESALTNHPQYRSATIDLMYYYDLASGAAVKVDLGWENGLEGRFEVTGDGFIAMLAAGVHNKAARYSRDGNTWRREWVEGAHAGNVFGFDFGKDNRTIVYNYSTASTPAQLYRAQLNGSRIESPVQLTDLNPAYKKKTIAKAEAIRWKGAMGEEVEGLLYYPHNYEAGKKYPLMVMIHGGPAGADKDQWSDRMGYPHNLMAQRGAFVFKPNYHGSSSYGLKWVESIGGGKAYDLEVPDIEKGVDYLIARGLIDANRLGGRGRRRLDKRLGQRALRRGLRQLLLRQVAARRPAALHPQVALLSPG